MQNIFVDSVTHKNKLFDKCNLLVYSGLHKRTGGTLEKEYLEAITQVIDLDIELDLLDGDTFFKLQDIQAQLQRKVK